jgi:hypothetical protein
MKALIFQLLEEEIQDFPRVCEAKQKYSCESAEKPRISQITTPSPDFASDCAPPTHKMSSFNIFALQSSDLPESGEVAQKNSERQPDQFATANVEGFEK